ncbi:electron transport complex subunit RsxC [Eubacteriales bacterium OttesenSCG-928-M02]|nr:electron transport complex subunit RsxC [Eubacteriales bacterium OttesenSCG-928-M02]
MVFLVSCRKTQRRERNWHAVFSVGGGVSPLKRAHEGKTLTAHKAITVMPAPQRVCIATVQGAGAPSKPVVAAGDHVRVGQLIAEAGGFVGNNIHSSISGTVEGIVDMPIASGGMVPHIAIVNNDGADEGYGEYGQREGDPTPQDVMDAIKDAGIVGMGGAGFPTLVKLSIPEGKTCEMLLINGAECEPFLTADHRLMVEQPHRILKGVSYAMLALGVEKAIIGIEENKPDAISTMTEAAKGHAGISIQPLRTKYPQGAEKQLIQAITGREVPSGGLPVDCGVVVLNIGTAGAIYDAVQLKKPVIERVVTVTGAVLEPQNILCRIGTSFQDAVAFCGGYREGVQKLVSGGPMMGFSLYTDTVGVTKGTSGILAMDEALAKETKETNCIRCGRCVDSCPIGLLPLTIDGYSRKENFDMAEQYHAMDCIECGCCSFICPSKRYLVQTIRQAKAAITLERRRAQQAEVKKNDA